MSRFYGLLCSNRHHSHKRRSLKTYCPASSFPFPFPLFLYSTCPYPSIYPACLFYFINDKNKRKKRILMSSITLAASQERTQSCTVIRRAEAGHVTLIQIETVIFSVTVLLMHGTRFLIILLPLPL